MASSTLTVRYVPQKPRNDSWKRDLFEMYFPGTREELLGVLKSYLVQCFENWNNRSELPKGTKLQKSPQFQIREVVEDGKQIQVLYGEATKKEIEAAALGLARVMKGLPVLRKKEDLSKPVKKEPSVEPLSYKWYAWSEEDGDPIKVRTNYPFREGLPEIIRSWGYEGDISLRETTFYLCRGFGFGKDGRSVPTFLAETHYELVLPDIPELLTTVGAVLDAASEELLERESDDRKVREAQAKALEAKVGDLPRLTSELMVDLDRNGERPIVVVFYNRGDAFKSKVWPPKPMQESEEGHEEKQKAKPIAVEPLQKALLGAQRLLNAKKEKIRTFATDLDKAAKKLGEQLKDFAATSTSAQGAIQQFVSGSLNLSDFMLCEEVRPLTSSRKFVKTMNEWEAAYGKLEIVLAEIGPAASKYKEAKRELHEAEVNNALLEGKVLEDSVNEDEELIPEQELPSLQARLASYLGAEVSFDAEAQVAAARNQMMVVMYAFWQGIIDLLPLSGKYQSQLVAAEESIRKHDESGDFSAFYDALYAPDDIIAALSEAGVEKAQAVYNTYDAIAEAVSAYNDAVTLLNADA